MTAIVLTATGSGGDVFPFVPVARELRRRGHAVRLAVPPPMVHVLRGDDLDLTPIGPFQGRAAIQRAGAFDHRLRGYVGLDQFFRMVLDALPRTVDELRPIVRGADLVVSHVFHPAAVIAARAEGVPIAILDLHPCFRPTRHEPPPGLPQLGHVGNSAEWALLRAVARRRVDRRVNDERRRAGLDPVRDVALEAGRCADLCLDLVDPVDTPLRDDWAVRALQVGYPYWDAPAALTVHADEQIDDALAGDRAPVVFTLGTALSLDPGSFYDVVLEALERCPHPAIVLGAPGLEVPPHLAGRVLVRGYVPMSHLLGGAAALVHHGGAGTTYAGLRHGCPAVVVPRCYDQGHHARRLRELDAGVVVPWRRLTADRLARAVNAVVADPRHRLAAQAVAARLARAAAPEVEAADALTALVAR